MAERQRKPCLEELARDLRSAEARLASRPFHADISRHKSRSAATSSHAGKCGRRHYGSAIETVLADMKRLMIYDARCRRWPAGEGDNATADIAPPRGMSRHGDAAVAEAAAGKPGGLASRRRRSPAPAPIMVRAAARRRRAGRCFRRPSRPVSFAGRFFVRRFASLLASSSHGSSGRPASFARRRGHARSRRPRAGRPL